MTNSVIGLLVAVSLATWLYTKLMRRSGGNIRSSLIVAGLAGIVVFIIVLTVGITVDGALK